MVWEVVKFVEEEGVRIPQQIKAHATPQSLRNYLRSRRKLLELQLSALEEKVSFLQGQLEEKRRQLQVLDEAIRKLGGE